MIEVSKSKKRNAENNKGDVKAKKFKVNDAKNKVKKDFKGKKFEKPAKFENKFAKPAEKANWSELKKQKKELKVKRKQQKAKGQYDVDVKVNFKNILNSC
jgi:pterin-4a-carbinolamine dehydratase